MKLFDQSFFQRMGVSVWLLFIVVGAVEAKRIDTLTISMAPDSLQAIAYTGANTIRVDIELPDSLPYLAGTTRVGPRRTAPIITTNGPAQTLATALEAITSSQTDSSKGLITVHVHKTTLSITETYARFSQTMTATIHCRVSMVDESTGGIVKEIAVHAEETRTAFDTTRWAQRVASGAMREAVHQVINTLNGL